ncbi:hypothetical protein [Roseivirga seohaensis]|uniref:hypothetical protein n=1 Tax=Roseivirga seohaensis TaxID=1914963 RepID=UPI003BAA2146
MTDTERFKKAIEYLLTEGFMKFKTDLKAILGIDAGRMTSLTRTKASKPQPREIALLRKKFPQINWDWVSTGNGEMLASENIVNEPEAVYGSKEWKKDELNRIVAGSSAIPIEERETILIAEVQRLQQIIVEAQEVNNSTLLQDLKNMLKGK